MGRVIQQDTTRFASVEDMIDRLRPSYPVNCLWPSVLRNAAAQFVKSFPGDVLYAVKCNPHPTVLKAMYDGGIRHFDTASLAEIGLIGEMFPDTTAYYHHPVKSRAMIETASSVWGIRYYALDHLDELDKVIERADKDAVAVVRIQTPKTDAVFDLAAKFGAPPETAVAILKAAAAAGLKTGISFHVGSQCRTPSAYSDAVAVAGKVIRDAAVDPVVFDVGGGFPVNYVNSPAPALDLYFEAITQSYDALGIANCNLICEPGRALVAEGQSLVVQVLLRKDCKLYINDGVYGSLTDLKASGLVMPARLIRPNEKPADLFDDFTIFGPTCDSVDVLPETWRLPADVREGDWIEVGTLGAYSNALASQFNGFAAETFVEIES